MACLEEILDLLAADFSREVLDGASREKILQTFKRTIDQYNAAGSRKNPWHAKGNLVRQEILVHDSERFVAKEEQAGVQREAKVFGEVTCSVWFPAGQKNPTSCCLAAAVLSMQAVNLPENDIKLLELRLRSTLNQLGGIEKISNSRLCSIHDGKRADEDRD